MAQIFILSIHQVYLLCLLLQDFVLQCSLLPGKQNLVKPLLGIFNSDPYGEVTKCNTLILSQQMPSTWLVAGEIVRKDGYGTRGLLKGVTATLARHGIFNCVYFGSYYNMKQILIPSEVNVLSLHIDELSFCVS